MHQIRPQVQWFARCMETELQDNDWKGGWNKCSVWELYQRLLEEAGELAGVLSGAREGNAISEAADIANFAMMIADRINSQALEATMQMWKE
ncbi:MAG: hypothetical protein ACREQA_20730 [Candidatus Binatia bacterium]